MTTHLEGTKPAKARGSRKPTRRGNSRFVAFFFGIYAVLRYHFHRVPLILETAFTLIWARGLTWFFPFRVYRARLSPSKLRGRPIEDIRIAEIAWAVSRLSRFFPGILNCLPQALTVQTMLRRRGTEADMFFGVKPTREGKIKAHAWIEWDQKVVIGELPDLKEYARLPSWPG